MSDLPTLIVDGDPILWYGISASGKPRRDTVRVDDLPTVRDPDGFMVGKIRVYRRFLRVDDRVTLATEEWETTGYSSTHRTQRLVERPFATATVTRIESILDWETDGADNHWLVTVSVEEL